MTTLYTVGHSTRTLEEFLELIRAANVRRLVDVRRYPGSRRHPHFARERLEESLLAVEVEYVWKPELGGRRKPASESRHTAWRVPAFAAYADHMESQEFEGAMEEVLTPAERSCTALMCAEARPEQCHRRLIADWLTIQGHRVLHLMTPTRATTHALAPFARVEHGRLIYDGGQLPLGN
jgi:uncharacterized protein (DUF488 family)